MLEKELMAEAAILYYEKKMTQQEIADVLFLSRQTVSKLLNEALKQNIVEITVHHPKKQCENLEEQLRKLFPLQKAVVSSAGSQDSHIRQIFTVKTAAAYLSPIFSQGNHNIGVSWGRTVQALIQELEKLDTAGNTVFPLFGATNHENAYFSSNELARSLADKLNAAVQYAWFPYLPDQKRDLDLFKNTSYYKSMCQRWEQIDLAIVGIGNLEMVELFRRTFGHNGKHSSVVGDLATHFFTRSGELIRLYEHTLCASAENIKNAKKTVAIACGKDKTQAIGAALRTGLIDVMITDEYTAAELITLQRGDTHEKI